MQNVTFLTVKPSQTDLSDHCQISCILQCNFYEGSATKNKQSRSYITNYKNLSSMDLTHEIDTEYTS